MFIYQILLQKPNYYQIWKIWKFDTFKILNKYTNIRITWSNKSIIKSI